MGSSLYLFRLMGIPVRMHWTFPLSLLMLGGFGPMQWGIFGSLFLTILVHEMGHCLAARSVGGGATQIVLWPLGGIAYTFGNRGNPLHSIWISLAGPLTHIPMAALCAGYLAQHGYVLGWQELNPLAAFDFHGSGLWQLYFYLVFKMQVLLFCFNVLTPAFPMDGGQVLASLFSTVMPLETAAWVMGGLTGASAYVMMSQGFTGIPLFLAYYAVTLVLTPASDWHPLAHFYQRAGVIHGRAAVYVPEGLQLVPCPQCEQKLHPGAEICVHCNTRYPFGQPDAK